MLYALNTPQMATLCSNPMFSKKGREKLSNVSNKGAASFGIVGGLGILEGFIWYHYH